MSTQLSFTLDQGASLTYTFMVQDSVGAAFSLTGCSAVLMVRKVYSTETIEVLAEQAVARLRHLGCANVEVRAGDGYYGWAEHAPYDGIIVTAAAPHIPQPLVDQLKPGARLVIPVGAPSATQQLMLIEKTGKDAHKVKEILAVVFVPLTGAHHDQPVLLESQL